MKDQKLFLRGQRVNNRFGIYSFRIPFFVWGRMKYHAYEENKKIATFRHLVDVQDFCRSKDDHFKQVVEPKQEKEVWNDS